MQPCYVLRHVGRTFDGKGGVRIEQLDIPANCMVAILGDSGCGKTTLLSILGGLTAAQPLGDGQDSCLELHIQRDGQVEIFDFLALQRQSLAQRLRDWFRRRKARDFAHELGFVFQEAHLLRNATVSVNLAISLAGRQLSRPASELIERLAHQLESAQAAISSHALPSKLMTRVRELSGGQAQRIALGRAIIRNPAIILADEPTASLDPRRGQRIMALLRHWQRQGDAQNPRTVIWVTHDTRLAAAFADKILVLRQGQLAPWIDGAPVDNPQDPQVLHSWIEGAPPDAVAPDPKRQQEMQQLRQQWEEQLKNDHGARLKTSTPRWRLPRTLVLAKLALSEVFSAQLNGASTLLQRAMSIVDRGYVRRLRNMLSGGEAARQAGQESAANSRWQRLQRPALAALGVAVFALAWALLSFQAAGESLLAQAALGFSGTLGLATAVVTLLWRPLFQAFGKWFDLLVFLMLLAVSVAAYKGWQVMGDIFAARMSSPELSHVMVQARKELLRDDVLKQIDHHLRQAGFAPPAASPTPRFAQPDTSFVWGRFINEAALDLPQEDGTCADAAAAKSVRADVMAAHMHEPFVQHLTFRTGKNLQQRKAFKPQVLIAADNARGIYITRQLAARLKRQLGVDVAALADTAEEGKARLCLHLMDSHAPVWIAGVIDKLPEDTLGYTYQLLMSVSHYKKALRESEKRAREYDVLAIYVDPRRVEAFLDHMQQLAHKGISVRLRDEEGRISRTRLKLNLGEAFAKVRDSLQLAEFFNNLVAGALGVLLTLAAIMAGVMSYNYIIRNERSLCVMRAFGISSRGIWGLMVAQFVMLLLPMLAVVALFAFLFWPQLAAPLAQWSGLPAASLLVSGRELLYATVAFAIVVLLGSLLATIFWYRQSRWVADRLKEIS